MTVFEEREQAIEAEYVRRKERRFQTRVRRNKLAGHWVAERLGLSEDQARRYIDDLIQLAYARDGTRSTIDKIRADLNAAGQALEPTALSVTFQKFEKQAEAELMDI